MRSLGEVRHLARRFWWTVRATPPPPEDDAWAAAQLGPGAAALWLRQHPLDRRHTVAVARRVLDPEWRAAVLSGDRANGDGGGVAVQGGAGGHAPPWVVEAALLHDVGKAEARMGAGGRTLATVLELAGARSAPGTVGRYLRYPQRGAELLAAAGARPEVVAWAREHHEPPGAWTVPRRWGALLVAADEAA